MRVQPIYVKIYKLPVIKTYTEYINEINLNHNK